MVKKEYQTPETEVMVFSLGESSLIMTSTGGSSGEKATIDDVYNPW
jgi:hypothetical protein